MSKITIKNRYGIAPDEILNNPNISLKAKGLYVFIQSKPDSWSFSIAKIARQNKNGNDSVQSAIQELEKFGYLKREAIKDDKGRWAGYDYTLSATPSKKEPLRDFSVVDKGVTLSKKDISKIDISKKDKEKKNSKKSFEKADSENILISPKEKIENIKTKIKDKLLANITKGSPLALLDYFILISKQYDSIITLCNPANKKIASRIADTLNLNSISYTDFIKDLFSNWNLYQEDVYALHSSKTPYLKAILSYIDPLLICYKSHNKKITSYSNLDITTKDGLFQQLEKEKKEIEIKEKDKKNNTPESHDEDLEY